MAKLSPVYPLILSCLLVSAGFVIPRGASAYSPVNNESIVFPPVQAGPYEIQFTVENPVLEVGEPLQFRMSYALSRLTSDNRFQVTWDLSHDVRVYIQYPNHPPVRVRNPLEMMLPPASLFEMDLGETQWLDGFALYIPESFSGLIFEQPGTYSVLIQVRAGGQAKEPELISAPPFDVRVTPPSPAGQKALDFLNAFEDVEQERALIRDLQASRPTPETEPLMRALLKAAPDSPLAPLALYALASEARLAERYDDVYRLAGELYRRFPNHPLADDALFFIAESYMEQGQDEKARETAVALLLQYPDTDRVRRRNRLYRDYIQPALRVADPGAWMLYPPGAAPTTSEWFAITGTPTISMSQPLTPPPTEAPPAPEGPPNVLLNPSFGMQ